VSGRTCLRTITLSAVIALAGCGDDDASVEQCEEWAAEAQEALDAANAALADLDSEAVQAHLDPGEEIRTKAHEGGCPGA
jgi:hypothetical protein